MRIPLTFNAYSIDLWCIFHWPLVRIPLTLNAFSTDLWCVFHWPLMRIPLTFYAYSIDQIGTPRRLLRNARTNDGNNRVVTIAIDLSRVNEMVANLSIKNYVDEKERSAAINNNRLRRLLFFYQCVRISMFLGDLLVGANGAKGTLLKYNKFENGSKITVILIHDSWYLSCFRS